MYQALNSAQIVVVVEMKEGEMLYNAAAENQGWFWKEIYNCNFTFCCNQQ
jgi:hypothetical protein